MEARDALKIVQAIENAAENSGGYEDHARGVVAAVLGDLARELAAEFNVPGCTCRWYHDGNKDCPRSAIEAGA